MSDAPLDNQPEPSSGKKFVFQDVFGLGKILDKLNINKLTIRMTYCILFIIILLGTTVGMVISRTTVMGFPTPWDMRAIILICVVVFFVGIWDKLKPTKET